MTNYEVIQMHKRNYANLENSIKELIEKYGMKRNELQNKFDKFKPKNPNRMSPTEKMWQQLKHTEIFWMDNFIENLKKEL